MLHQPLSAGTLFSTVVIVMTLVKTLSSFTITHIVFYKYSCTVLSFLHVAIAYFVELFFLSLKTYICTFFMEVLDRIFVFTEVWYICRCGMVYIDAEELKWMPYVQTWMTEKCKKLTEETREYLLSLFSKYVENGLRFIQKNCTQAIATVDISKVVTLCKLLEVLILGPGGPDLKMDLAKLHSFIALIFVFSYLWSVGGNILDTDWDRFDTFIRQQFEDNADVKVCLVIRTHTVHQLGSKTPK